MTRLLAAPAILALIIALAEPILFLPIGGLLVLGALAAVCWVAGERGRRIDELEDTLRQSDEALAVVEVERDIANGLLADYKANARVVVPIQRRCSCGHPIGSSGIHSTDCDVYPTQYGPATHESWPIVARAVEAEAVPIHDGFVVDVFMEQVDRWGNEVEQ